jgi:hypothetical protein
MMTMVMTMTMQTYWTACCFCLCRLYLSILGKQRDIVAGNESRYKGGLQKLADTEKMVNDLQEKLTEMRPFLQKAAR